MFFYKAQTKITLGFSVVYVYLTDSISSLFFYPQVLHLTGTLLIYRLYFVKIWFSLCGQ